MVTSYNGWTASPDPRTFGGLRAVTVGGETFAPGVRYGDVADVLEYVAEQVNARVEPIVRADWHQADDWGYNYRPNRNDPSSLSCHGSATAIDYNATRHPNGVRGTFSAAQVAELERILTEVEGVVRWGGSFTGTPDEMHFEIVGNVATVARVATRIRANGGPERRLGSSPAPVVPRPPAIPAVPGLPAWNLPAGHYYGHKLGPALSHGGYYAAERDEVRAIQRRLIAKGCVLGVTDWRSSWADGVWEDATTAAVRRWFARYRPGQQFTDRIYRDDYAVLAR